VRVEVELDERSEKTRELLEVDLPYFRKSFQQSPKQREKQKK